MNQPPKKPKGVTEPGGDQPAQSRLRKWLKRGVWALAIYTVLGFLILPPIVRAVAEKQLAKALHREVRIEKVRMNPYAFSIAIRGLKVTDPDAETLLSWDEVRVSFRIYSIFTHAWKFGEIAVINPYLRVQMNQDRTLNFSDLLDLYAGMGETPEKHKERAKPIAVRVGQLLVDGARISIADLTPRTPFRRRIGPIKVIINDFHSEPNYNSPHVFTGTTETGETFTWGGQFSIAPIAATGEFGVDNLTLTNFAPLYEDLVNFEIRDGVAGFRLNYQFLKSPVTNIATVSNLSFTMRSFKLGTPGAEENLIELPELTVAGGSGDVFARRGEVESVSVRGASLNIARAKGAEFNVMRAAQPNANLRAPGGILLLMRSVTNAMAQLLSSTNLAAAMVRNIAVEDCAVTLLDDSPGRPVLLRVDQINATAKNLSNRPETNLIASLALRWNTNGTVKTEVEAALNPLKADVRMHVDQIELAPLSPYLGPIANLNVLGSKAGLEGAIRLRSSADQIPVVTFAGNAALDNLNLVSGDGDADLLQWSSLHFDGITANLNPPAINVTNVTLINPALHVLIETNGAINVMSIMRTGNTNAPAAGAESSPAATEPKPAGGGAIKRAFAQVKTLLGMRTNVSTSLPKVDIQNVTVDNAELQFTDRSVTPEARASVSHVNGTIQDISTGDAARTQIHLTALAGGTGPIEVTAQLNPLHAKEATAAKVTMKRVKLTPADPYSAKFLGYRLTRGELNMDVEYSITASQVKGSNMIVLDQPTLGSKVASSNATSLPVKLGLALLKDSSGKVEINVPVEGNLDDPQFRLGPVIWHVIGNVFVKAMTSPFSLLGSLLGGKGGEEMQFQEFTAGSAELDATAREKLASIAKALALRPELEVEVEGNVDPELDGAALRRAKVELQLRTAYWQSLRAAARTNTTPEDVVLPPGERSDRLAAEYRRAIKADPQLAVAAAAFTNAAAPIAPSGATQAHREIARGAVQLMHLTTPPPPSSARPGAAPTRVGLTEEQMMQALMTRVALVDADYAALAKARARQVQSLLVADLKVATERVVLSDPGATGYAINGHRVNLQLR